ncbi:[FeFe] hydrogenase H-cluster radical SAM maturase HydE [Candidatus Woesearchaeota archaeon]|nr:[FeFe] hydrogenase H-cluster radical SAM maturase HydE [Candidatus Woesearchaeota archaeon]
MKRQKEDKMCLAIPGKVESIAGNRILIDYLGEKRGALNEDLDLNIGEYVFVQAGFVIQKVPEDIAVESLKIWKDKLGELKQLDHAIALKKLNLEQGSVRSEIKAILEKAEKSAQLTREEFLMLLKTNNENELRLLYKIANKIRHDTIGNSCCVHGIIEFSNYCKNDCKYCGLRSENSKLKRYRMEVDEIVDAAVDAVENLGFKALVLQSGEDAYYATEKLVEIIKKIKERCGVVLFMSVGERDKECYQKMYDAGAKGVLFRFETSNKNLYGQLHSSLKYKDRIEHLEFMADVGFLIASGGLIGLPGQTEEDLLDDLLYAKKLNLEMVSFGPFIPHENTPLGNTKVIGLNNMLKFLAVARLVMPAGRILVTTALETLDNIEGRRLGLLAGASSFMINITPAKYRELYSLYPDKAGAGMAVKELIDEAMEIALSLGRLPTDIKGYSNDY